MEPNKALLKKIMATMQREKYYLSSIPFFIFFNIN